MPFKKDDVVVRKVTFTSTTGGDPKTITTDISGRVCRVVTEGKSYMVRYDKMDMCLLQFERSIEHASGDGPSCLDDGNCL